MSNEQLMKPRYIVIADYPGTLFKDGEIITPETNGHQYWIWQEDDCVHVGSYPHLFRKLEWWEYRKPEEIPEYVKYLVDGIIYKVGDYEKRPEGFIAGQYAIGFRNSIPSTETEYHANKES